MQNAVKIIIEANLDAETLTEIGVMRNLRLTHYRNIEKFPERALAALKKVGLTEEPTLEDLQANARTIALEIETRLKEPNTIYEDELTFYVDTLNANLSDNG